MSATGFDFTSFEAATRRMDRNLIAQARALAAAKGISELRLVIASIPGHETVTIASKDVYPYATGVMSDLLRRLADLAERELDRNA